VPLLLLWAITAFLSFLAIAAMNPHAISAFLGAK
jgi:hypothetical protein